MTWRRFGVLAKALPADAAATRALQRDAPVGKQRSDSTDWPLEAQLLGHVLDTLASANWQRGGGKGPRPKSIMAVKTVVGNVDDGVDVRPLLSRGAPDPPGG